MYFVLYNNGQVLVEIPQRFTEDPIGNGGIVDLIESVQSFFDKRGLSRIVTVYATINRQEDFAYDPKITIDADGLTLYIPSVFTQNDFVNCNRENFFEKTDPTREPIATTKTSLSDIVAWAEPLIASHIKRQKSTDAPIIIIRRL